MLYLGDNENEKKKKKRGVVIGEWKILIELNN
jgi:hypothetical protein